MCEWGTYPFYDAAVDRTIRMSNQNKTKTVHGNYKQGRSDETKRAAAVAAPKNVRPGAGCRRRTENVRRGTVVWPDAVAAPKNVRPGIVAFAAMATSVKAALLSHAVAYGILFRYN